MRIIAGKYRHREIYWPEDNINIRPTKDRIREAIYSAIGDISDYIVLDLYAGSGAMGIEALSRGAAKAYFVDNNKVALSTINKNIDSLKIDNAKVINSLDFDALNTFKNEKLAFDLLIIDPPYKSETYMDVIKYILDNDIANKNAIFVIESKSNFDYDSFAFNKVKRYHYGEINVDIIWR